MIVHRGKNLLNIFTSYLTDVSSDNENTQFVLPYIFGINNSLFSSLYFSTNNPKVPDIIVFAKNSKNN